MKKSTFHYSTQVAAYPQRLRQEIIARGERGSISVETVVIALGLFALATLIVGLLTAWATGKLGGLS
ncbi:hypothetical protein [Ornithinimicrobium avium]|uniref:Uncharacterized protein n=1 Tax=Ornithinimicrobium avium TaxID=2283195 RepID=A0A345NLW1_9MICO|nr:hypothetical protein [Ornithinimicrobium avium]AXH96019.1 hypothetical protein DV701_07660 [Ornithinimicrobium avium]